MVENKVHKVVSILKKAIHHIHDGNGYQRYFNHAKLDKEIDETEGGIRRETVTANWNLQLSRLSSVIIGSCSSRY